MPRYPAKGKADVQCPFYKFDDCKGKRIICEGIVAESTLTLTYYWKKGYEKQLGVFCCEHYKNCEIYRMLMEAKYDEED